MPVTTQHPQFIERQSEWCDCRDAGDGQRAIKARGEEHLPRLTEQTDDEYKAYLKRALWYGATGRTIQGLVGSVFRKPMQVKVPTGIEEQLKDITLTGITLETFCKTTLGEILKVGRYGILVDMGKAVQPGAAPAQDRPYWVGYIAERIINWSTSQVAGDTVLTQVVLSEEATEKDPLDQFKEICISQYRVLRLVENRYLVEIWRKSKDRADEWMIHETINPVFRGQPLDYIPFCFLGPSNLAPAPEKPPLLDLVDVNLSHYRSSADLEHGRHYTALPTPWVAGFPTDVKLRIGSSIAWVSDRPEASAGMLEFTGQGLGALEKALESKEGLMAILGARMLEEQKKAVEAADTHTIRNAGESSVMQSLAGTTELGLLKALQWHARWTGQDQATIELELNKVFVESRMDPTELAELVRTWQAGAISEETLYWNMQRGELTMPGDTYEDEKARIEAQAPARLPLADPNPQDPYGDPNQDPNPEPAQAAA